jgi:hypothetical protein
MAKIYAVIDCLNDYLVVCCKTETETIEELDHFNWNRWKAERRVKELTLVEKEHRRIAA